MVALLVFGASFSNIISQQDAVHFALSWSLVNTHSAWLNGTMYSGQPYVTASAGHLVSSLPPGLAYFGFAFVAPAPLILPMEPSVVAAYLATYFACITGALACIAFYKVARMFAGGRSSILLSLVFVFGTSMWIYSRMYLPEGLATLLGIASVYFLLRSFSFGLPARGEYSSAARRVAYPSLYLSGILLGLAIFVDNMSVFLVVPIAAYIALRQRGSGGLGLLHQRRRSLPLAKLTIFILGLIVGSIPTWYYDAITTGSIFTAPYGNPIIGGVPSSAYESGLLQGLDRSILSPQGGLLLFTPFLIVSAAGIIIAAIEKGLRRKLEEPAKKIGGDNNGSERLEQEEVETPRDETSSAPLSLFVGLFLAVLIPFSLQSQFTYLHNTIGPAELVLAVPYALFPSLVVMEKIMKAGKSWWSMKVIIYALAILSMLINGIIALTDPINQLAYLPAGAGGSVSNPFLTTNLPLFLGQSYLTWWSFFQHPAAYACAVLVFPIVVFFIYAFGASPVRGAQLGGGKVVEEVRLEPILRQRQQLGTTINPGEKQQKKQRQPLTMQDGRGADVGK